MRHIYLAGPYAAREQLAVYGAEIERVGYILTARWLSGAFEAQGSEGTAEEQGGWARDDLADVARCDVLVAFTNTAAGHTSLTGGRHIETGYAIARSKTVVLVGEPENIFHWLPGIQRCVNWHDALIFLAARLSDPVPKVGADSAD